VLGVVLVLSLLAAFASAGQWNAAGIPEDEGLLLEYPQLIIHGEVPFRDFQSSYGPGAYLPLVATYALLGPSVHAERAIGIVYRLAVVFAIVALLWPLGLSLARLGGVVSLIAILTSPYISAFGWYYAVACLLWSLWAARAALTRAGSPGGLWLWVGSGVLAGSAVGARFDLGLAAICGVMILAFRVRWRERFALAGGFTIGALPLVWDVAAAGWSNFWTYGIQARLHELPESGYPLPQGLGFLAILAFATLLLMMGAIRALRRSGASPVTLSWLALGAVAVLILPQAIQRADNGHFAYVAPVTLGSLPLIVWQGRRWFLNGLFLVLVSFILIYGVVSMRSGDGSIVRNGGHGFPVDPPSYASGMNAVLDWADIHVPRGSRLFVGPSDLRWALGADTVMYYLQPRLPHAGFYLEFGPGDNTQRFTARLIHDLREADVLELDTNNPAGLSALWPEAQPGSSSPDAVVRRYFKPVFRAGSYSVWIRSVRARRIPLTG
jgi:hypothetical protein